MLHIFSGLCTAISEVQKSSGKKPCLIYFARDDTDLSVYTGMPVSTKASGKVLTFLNDLFAGQLNNSSFVSGSLEKETLEKLALLPGYLPRPPRIIFQEIPSGEKFVLLKFTF